MTVLGKIEKIWRYPVKGMQGEEISEVFTGFGGVMGDRVYGIINAAGEKGFPWFTARDDEDFMLYRPRFKSDNNRVPGDLAEFEGIAPGIHPLYPEPDQFAVEVESPEGQVFDIELPAFNEHMSKRFEVSLRTHLSAQKSQVDCRPLSLISQQTCNQLSSELDMNIDYRRFRPNFLINWSNGEGYYENSLIGKRLKIGERCEITFLERDPRCKMITLDPDTGDSTPKILKHVTLAHEGYAGAYGAVLAEGVIKEGDEISLI